MASDRGSELIMSFLVILSLWIRAPSNGNGGIGMGYTRTSGLSTVHFSVCHPQRHSNHTIDGFFVTSVLRFPSPNFSGSEHAICIPNEALCAVVSHSKPNPILISGVHSVPRFCGDSSCQHLLSKRNKLLWWLLSVHPLKWRLSISTFLAPGQAAPGMLHQPRCDWRLVTK